MANELVSFTTVYNSYRPKKRIIKIRLLSLKVLKIFIKKYFFNLLSS